MDSIGGERHGGEGEEPKCHCVSAAQRKEHVQCQKQGQSSALGSHQERLEETRWYLTPAVNFFLSSFSLPHITWEALKVQSSKFNSR